MRRFPSWNLTCPALLWGNSNGGWKDARTKGYCRRNIYNSSTVRRHSFILSRIINNPFTDVVSIDFIYIYNVKKKLWFDFVDNFLCRIKQWMCAVILDRFVLTSELCQIRLWTFWLGQRFTSTMVKLSSFNFQLVIKSSNMSYALYFLTFSIMFVQILALFFFMSSSWSLCKCTVWVELHLN